MSEGLDAVQLVADDLWRAFSAKTADEQDRIMRVLRHAVPRCQAAAERAAATEPREDQP